ncbi:NAD-dependent succinate-semialdehyde dehydrogenase [Herbaspirillum sp. RV1423]|uniref:NAD-dependent succinate-semialdehyde dehydrogenase n=1 Tax=Herbaspirillum sp. RV1423 TaxID=1443993 RepID=UPI0004B0DD25|nr:NAD-dependent succinate-semialdehyde dehydrogenase [Herbaspirillum sp. RV1423]
MNTSYESLALFIDGEFRCSSDGVTMPVMNPATNEILGQLPKVTTDDLDAALQSAESAFHLWSRTSPLLRSDVLRRFANLARAQAESIGRNITLDQGKPLFESIAEVKANADHADWHAEECRRIYGRVIPSRSPEVRQFVIREPIGVCAAFTPWNFPFGQAIRKISAAIGAGCSIILKGPEESPSAVMAIARLFSEAGLPKGVLNIIWGDPAAISRHLISSPIVQKVSFTGSVPVGKHLAALAGTHMKRGTWELGGHSPVIVFDDADIHRAAVLLAQNKVRNAGQVCVSPTRFYVQENAYDQFLEVFTDTVSAIKVGNGLDADVGMGPLAHDRRVDAMSRFMDDADQRGATIHFKGHAPVGPGSYFPVTVVTGLHDDAMLMNEEPFGPIAPIVRFSTFEEVVKRANRLPFGLSSYVFTESLKTSAAAAQQLQVGMVNINHFGSALPETPFGGIKDSGMGSEGGTETFDGYLTTKFITQV